MIDIIVCSIVGLTYILVLLPKVRNKIFYWKHWRITFTVLPLNILATVFIVCGIIYHGSVMGKWATIGVGVIILLIVLPVDVFVVKCIKEHPIKE